MKLYPCFLTTGLVRRGICLLLVRTTTVLISMKSKKDSPSNERATAKGSPILSHRWISLLMAGLFRLVVLLEFFFRVFFRDYCFCPSVRPRVCLLSPPPPFFFCPSESLCPNLFFILTVFTIMCPLSLLQVSTGAYERLVFTVPGGTPVTSRKDINRITWASWTR